MRVKGGTEDDFMSTAYRGPDGALLDTVPADADLLARCRPVFEEFPGWPDDLTGIRRWADLPAAARDYVRALSDRVGVPATIASVGPDRAQTIDVDR